MHELKTSLQSETMNESETHNDCESSVESMHAACVQCPQIQSFFDELKGEKVNVITKKLKKPVS